MGDTWQLVHCCVLTCVPLLPSCSTGTAQEQQGELGLSWGIQELCVDIWAPSCSRAQGLHSPVYRYSQKCGLSWLRPQGLAVSACRATVISSLSFCLHFQRSISLITAGPLPIMLWNASGATGGKKGKRKRSNCGLYLRRKKLSVRTSSYQKWDKEYLFTKSFMSVDTSKTSHSPPH